MTNTIRARKALPFEPLVPNADKIGAMKGARHGDLVTVGSAAALLASLNAGEVQHGSTY